MSIEILARDLGSLTVPGDELVCLGMYGGGIAVERRAQLAARHDQQKRIDAAHAAQEKTDAEHLATIDDLLARVRTERLRLQTIAAGRGGGGDGAPGRSERRC